MTCDADDPVNTHMITCAQIKLNIFNVKINQLENINHFASSNC